MLSNLSGADGAVDTPANDYVMSGDEETPEPVKVKEPESKEAPVEQNDEEDGEADDNEGKKRRRGGFQKKLERKDATIADLQDQLERLKTPKTEITKDTSAKPKLDDFETYEDYYEALADWKVDDKLKSKEVSNKEQSLRQELAARANDYDAKAKELAKTVPDYDETIEDYDGPLTTQMSQALLESDIGPELAYYIAKNPEEGEKLSQMGVVAMNKYIGRLEARIEYEKSKEPTVVKTTKAPPPIKPIGKGSSGGVFDVETASFEEYKKARVQGKL